MNNSEQITVSLEVAKKLKAEGWPHKNHYFYYDTSKELADHEEVLIIIPEPSEYYGGLAAPTVEEILKVLPSSIQVYRTRARENGWTCAYAVQGILLKGKSGADVTANMWLHLKANNLLPPIII